MLIPKPKKPLLGVPLPFTTNPHLVHHREVEMRVPWGAPPLQQQQALEQHQLPLGVLAGHYQGPQEQNRPEGGRMMRRGEEGHHGSQARGHQGHQEGQPAR
jgi:hypothetical protein